MESVRAEEGTSSSFDTGGLRNIHPRGDQWMFALSTGSCSYMFRCAVIRERNRGKLSGRRCATFSLRLAEINLNCAEQTKKFSYRREAPAVYRCCAIYAKSRQVCFSAVSLMLGEAVSRILFM